MEFWTILDSKQMLLPAALISVFRPSLIIMWSTKENVPHYNLCITALFFVSLYLYQYWSLCLPVICCFHMIHLKLLKWLTGARVLKRNICMFFCFAQYISWKVLLVVFEANDAHSVTDGCCSCSCLSLLNVNKAVKCQQSCKGVMSTRQKENNGNTKKNG